ncbi:MAG: molybdenum cofactor biosynthesis protein MoaE [Lachnospiraceae bacterium]|nr:molybdenum cofactor biosynthesis protein MoaE [Lachnospiraceae bacterium]
MAVLENTNERPSLDEWLKEAKASKDASHTGMYLFHTGVVREDSRAFVRDNAKESKPVRQMQLSVDRSKVDIAVSETLSRNGIFHVKVWLNEGLLSVGDEIMIVLIGGDIRPNVLDAIQFLVGKIKKECVSEKEIF